MEGSPNKPELGADPPNFYEFVFGVSLSPQQLETDHHHHFVVDSLDATLEKVQQYIASHGRWEVLLPKTALTRRLVAAIATNEQRLDGLPSDIVFIDEDLDKSSLIIDNTGSLGFPELPKQ